MSLKIDHQDKIWTLSRTSLDYLLTDQILMLLVLVKVWKMLRSAIMRELLSDEEILAKDLTTCLFQSAQIAFNTAVISVLGVNFHLGWT